MNKRWKKIVATVLAMTLVLANITSVFAGKGGNNNHDKNDKNDKFSGTYSHLAIAIETEDGSGYSLAEKPTVILLVKRQKKQSLLEMLRIARIMVENISQQLGDLHLSQYLE